MGVGGEAAGISRRSLTKPGWSGPPACHSLGDPNNREYTGAATSAGAATLPLVLTPGCRGRFTHCHTLAPTRTHQRGGGGGGGAQARLLWLEIGAGIINHRRLPAAESGLSGCAGNAPSKSRAPAGGRARRACWGIFATSGGTSITPAQWDRDKAGNFKRASEWQLPPVTDSPADTRDSRRRPVIRLNDGRPEHRSHLGKSESSVPEFRAGSNQEEPRWFGWLPG